jgi:hypothetical protein
LIGIVEININNYIQHGAPSRRKIKKPKKKKKPNQTKTKQNKTQGFKDFSIIEMNPSKNPNNLIRNIKRACP